MRSLTELGAAAKAAATLLASTPSGRKDAALLAMADALCENSADILAENAQDLAAGQAAGLSAALLERLTLNETRIHGMADSIRAIAAQTDPIGQVIGGDIRPNGLQVQKVRTPLGVVGIIFESRPNVTSDAAALCLKAGNASLLRGGKEAIRSNVKIAEILRAAIASAGLPADSVIMLADTSRETANEMMRLNGYIDVLIPRGGAGLIRTVVENATVPVIETGVGNCHLFIDQSAGADMAVKLAVTAKTSRPSVCNAIETLLVHAAAADQLLPKIAAEYARFPVTIYGCDRSQKLLGAGILPATEQEYATEFNDLTIAVRIVDNLEEAMAHIRRYSSGHSECIVTESYANAQRFTAELDAAALYVNASPRFTDGGEFGLGAEIGISTQKLHARGPMGVEALTSIKYIVRGNGQTR